MLNYDCDSDRKQRGNNTIDVLTATMIMTVTMIIASNDCV